MAYKYAQQLQPFRSASEFQEIYDGLGLGACNASFTHAPASVGVNSHLVLQAFNSSSNNVIYVDPVHGSDGNSGSISAPLQHVASAVALSRTLPPPSTIVLRGGVHRLTDTLSLGPQDNGLTITAYPGETPVMTSGVIIPISAWTPYNVSVNRTMSVYNNSNNVYGQAGTVPSIVQMGTFNNSDDCLAACMARPNCTSWTWHGLIYPGWAGTCWERSDSVWAPTQEADIVSGYWGTPQNVWVADVGVPGGSSSNPLPTWLNTPARPDFVMSLMYSEDGGATTQRATRARWPNANPEMDRFPTGWTAGGTYQTTAVNEDTEVVHVPNPNPGDPQGMFATEYVHQ